MQIQDSLFLQALIFSTLAAGVMLLSAWWFYLSPLKHPPARTAPPSLSMAGLLAALLGIAAILWVVGALWDASMHIRTGEIPGGADFLWPPHLLLYSGFLLAFLVAIIAIGKVAVQGWRAGRRDPRHWIRQNPYLGAVALASLFELMAIPGDAIWHEIFGEDLTAWSPPHVLLGVMSGAVILSAVGVLMQTRHSQKRAPWRNITIVALLGLMLNVVYILAVIEWELPVRSPLVDARPLWYYPLVGGSAAFFTLALARYLVQGRWAATATAGAFYLVRLAVTAGLDLTDNVTPAMPLAFLLGAFLMDVLPWSRVPSRTFRWVLSAAAFTLGYSLLALPLLNLRHNLPTFTPLDLQLSVTGTLLASLLLLPLARWVGQGLSPKGAPDR